MLDPTAYDVYKADIKNNKLKFQHVEESGVPGTYMYVATIPTSSVPVGVVWYGFGERNRLDIYHSYTW